MLRRITLYREVKHAWLAKSAGSAPVDLCTYVMHTYYTNYTYVCIYLSIYIYTYTYTPTPTVPKLYVCVRAHIRMYRSPAGFVDSAHPWLRESNSGFLLQAMTWAIHASPSQPDLGLQ